MVSSFASCDNPNAAVFIKHCWEMSGNPAYAKEWILPKGEIELIFSFGDALNYDREGFTWGITPRCFINGISNVPVCLSIPKQQHFFGVILQPAAVKHLLSAPAGVFLNTITDLELVDSSFGQLWHQLGTCNVFEERVGIVESWVLQKQARLYE